MPKAFAFGSLVSITAHKTTDPIAPQPRAVSVSMYEHFIPQNAIAQQAREVSLYMQAYRGDFVVPFGQAVTEHPQADPFYKF
jgi:hypothetical protein